MFNVQPPTEAGGFIIVQEYVRSEGAMLSINFFLGESSLVIDRYTLAT